MMDPLIDVRGVSKTFCRGRRPQTLLGRIRRGSAHSEEPFHALRDVSFTVARGESFGIIGANGSGKSTLLKIIAGVTIPTSGSVVVRGRVASLLELGAGFHPLLTGRENIYLNSRLLGMSRAQTNAVLEEIIEFSGVREFIDNPVDTYSSGMYVRLGFAVAVYSDPDIFLVDEVLSVGDEAFQRKCRGRIAELIERGKTIVFVSHDLAIVNALCARALLLTQGEPVLRNTAQDTIDFYLRQVGRAEGIHRLSANSVDAVLNNGRISLFRDGREIGSPAGFSANLVAMEQDHHATNAEWRIKHAGSGGCTAIGRLTRLPVVHEWTLRLEDGRLVWQIALDIEREVTLQFFGVYLRLPTWYAHWFLGERRGAFPEILPGDLRWSQASPAGLDAVEAGAIADDSNSHPAIQVTIRRAPDFVRMQWHNTEYVAGNRALEIGGRFPEHAMPLAAGRHEMIELVLDCGIAAEDLRRRADALEQRRFVVSGPIAVQFDRGMLRIAWNGEEITTFVHWYTSILIGDLWNDSHNLQWGEIQRSMDALEVTGESRRFPFRQHWRVNPKPDAIALTVWIEALEDLTVNEYHCSIALDSRYDRWQTAIESGTFPPFDPNQQDWRHANHSYQPGKWIRALCSPGPDVTLRVTTDKIYFRMTAINTGFFQNARVLQALRTPDAGAILLSKGRHLYFDGVIELGESEVQREQ